MDRAFPITSTRASRFSREGSPCSSFRAARFTASIPAGSVCRYVIATILLLRYPHGKFRGGLVLSPLFPAFTSSSWRENNFLLLEYDI